MKTKLVTLLLISIFTLGLFSSLAPQVDAKVTSGKKVNVTFMIDGLGNYNGDIITIDGQSYTKNWVPSLSYLPGSTIQVSVLEEVTEAEWYPDTFRFSSWTNGNGLAGVSGTFVVPNYDVTVTANYEVVPKVFVEFEIAGLGDYNNHIITIDGETYTKNNIPSQFYWFTGSTHSVSVETPVSLAFWPYTTYYFSGWTNGNGLTGSSGTFTVPSSDTTIIANYGSSPALETVLTISCTLDSVSGGTAAIISGWLSSCSSGIASKSIVLTYYDGANWNSIGSSVTSSDGTYSYNWIVPEDLENGVYPVKAEFQGDTEYLSSSAVTGSAGSLMVVPEFPLGGLVALLACFSSAFIFIKLRSKGNC